MCIVIVMHRGPKRRLPLLENDNEAITHIECEHFNMARSAMLDLISPFVLRQALTPPAPQNGLPAFRRRRGFELKVP